MCKIVEDMCIEAQKEALMAVAGKLLFEGTLTPEKISECCGLSLDEVKKAPSREKGLSSVMGLGRESDKQVPVFFHQMGLAGGLCSVHLMKCTSFSSNPL